MSSTAAYTERSWAIDLIGHLKHLARQNNRSIKDAGGERTIKTEGGPLFPDVLLFGDHDTARILQGWELKMPDTGIDDPELRSNAETKARALGLDSFLLWNVSHAHLYIKECDTGNYAFHKEWSDLSDVTTRDQVNNCRTRWMDLAKEILGYLNDLFDRGAIEGRQFIDAYESGGITALMMNNSGLVAAELAEAANRDSILDAQITLWWEKNELEYAGETKEQVLAQAIISNWIGKLLFAHILREKDSRAHQIANIDKDTTPASALELFRQLSSECNFWTIFSDSIGLERLPDQAWSHLKQFNNLLSDLRIGSIDQQQLSSILEATVTVATRKLRGQYTTPIELARILVNLCVRDTHNDRIIDPCCGSGTIARAALEKKLAANTAPSDAAASVLASDQDPQAIQVTTFSLAKPNLMHVPLRVFQRDAFNLSPTTDVQLRDPTNGTAFTEQLGQFDAITSNLPFISQDGRKRYVDAIEHVKNALSENGENFSGRADVAAYLPFALHPLLKERGILGIIITNAWLGTDWGESFYKSIGRYYDLKTIITSGSGRWFQNSEVVTNVIIMQKKETPEKTNEPIQFVTLLRPLYDIADDQAAKLVAAQISVSRPHDDNMNIREVSPTHLERFRPFGLMGNAQFVDCDWILELPLTPLKDLFNVSRGERRGKNALFYPAPGHGIETEYIRPLVKSPDEFTQLTTSPTKEAFSCSRDEEELNDLGHTGALQWINRFRTPSNVSKLARSNLHWYEMNADTLTELVMFISYGERLFVGRINPPSFVDQRLVRLAAKADIDIELCHALMNSTIGMFIIEGLGFGRGLTALDLNKDRIGKYMHLLNPNELTDEGARRIKKDFAPLQARTIMKVADELDQPDRQKFDDTIIESFNLNIPRSRVYESLRELVDIRMSARD